MGTALLVEDEDVVWGGEAGAGEEDWSEMRINDEDLPEIMNISEEDWSKLNDIVQVGLRLRLEGHDVVFAKDEDDGFDFRQYIDPRILKRLDEVKLDKNWRDKQE